MTDRTPAFRSVMRGYDPAQVDAHLAELDQAFEAARREADDRTVELSRTQSAHAELGARLEQARRQVAELEEAQRAAAAPTYADLGERIGQILTLADEEAADLRARAQEQASRLVEEAQHRAADLLDEADRAALARREEAEALFERQRATMAAAAADFETTLATRRRKAAEEFAAELAAHQQGLAQVEERASALAQESEVAHADARTAAQAVLDRARVEADQVVAAARDQAARVRTESERELAAATARRDSINAQLANVRQMLATLGGAALSPEPGAGDPHPDEQPSAEQTDGQPDDRQQHEQQPHDQHEQPAATH